MSIIATAVRHLIAAGVTGDALVTAIAEMEACIRAEPKPRSAGAIRQARHRENKRNEASQVTESDACNALVSPPPPNDIYSNPPPPLPTHSLARDAFPCPEWCEPGIWADLKRNRRAKKLASTATAHRQFLREIAKFTDDEWPPGRLVEAIVAKGWGGAYDPRDTEKPKQFSGQTKGGSLVEIGERVRQAYGI